jgi:hypothetical protein
MLRPSTIIALACTGALLAACVTEAKYPQRAAEVACTKLEECSPEAYTDACQETYEDLIEASVDECDAYRGGLAHRCLDAVEEQGCDDFSTPSACEEFNEKCGFDGVQPVGEMNVESHGLGQLRPVQPNLLERE